jgi:hypothetical protein
MLEGDWTNSGPGDVVYRASVSASPQQVKEACRSWADDLHWFTADSDQDGPYVFRLNRFSWMTRNPTIEVVSRRQGHRTQVEFRASLKFLSPAVCHKDLRRLAERFANGVCHELALSGAAVEPASLAEARQNRQRPRTISRLNTWVFWGAFTAVAPIGLIVALATWSA